MSVPVSRYQGQYEDSETGLYYNRFRYYSPDEGIYISQDPIRLGGGLSLYSYVHDTNGWVDVLGLAEHITFPPESLHPGTVTPSNPTGTYKIQATGSYHGDKVALYREAKLTESFSNDFRSHHVSYDASTNEMTMQLVKTGDHSVDHEGGAKDFRDYHQLSDDLYGSEAAKEAAEKQKKLCQGG